MTDRPTRSRQKATCRIAPVKPRNPLVAPAMKRVAGPHRKSTSAGRSADRAALQRVVIDEDDV